MISYAKTDTGLVRRSNQDFLFAADQPVGPLPNLFIVADGMGGHKAGDFASRYVVEHMKEYIENSDLASPVMILRKALEKTNQGLFEEAQGNPDREGMGSTLVAATIEDDMMYVANVGDSRLYLLRDSLAQITRDHSLVEEMVARGKMERDSESYRSQKNIITRAMGIGNRVEADFFEVPLLECDCILLCSDGLTNMVDDAEISRVLKTTDTLKEKTEALVDEANRNVNHASFWLTVHRQTIASFPNFFVYLARILILVCAGVLASRGINHPVGTIAISFAATASLSSTFNLTFVVTSLLETYGAAERIFKIEDTMSETEEPANPVSCGEIQTIEFSDVTFSYPGTEKKVLDHFNFKIRKGEKIGIAGASGAGKSTILRLLLRFYAPAEGEIRINGIPLEQISFAELHQRIAFLEQDTYLFDATIAENIAIAKPDASIEEIRTAAERAGIAEFIETLPEGYQTDMGQMSARLSGGERQRIGIARIFLRDPDLCLMDEPSSTLDAQHEKELLHTLKTEYGKKDKLF